MVTKWSPSALHVVIKWSSSCHQVVTKLSTSCHQVITKRNNSFPKTVILLTFVIKMLRVPFLTFVGNQTTNVRFSCVSGWGSPKTDNVCFCNRFFKESFPKLEMMKTEKFSDFSLDFAKFEMRSVH